MMFYDVLYPMMFFDVLCLKSILFFLLSERTSRVSPVIFFTRNDPPAIINLSKDYGVMFKEGKPDL